MIEFLSGLPVHGLFVVAVVVLAMESGSPIGLFLPGSPTLLALGLLSRQGVTNPWAAVLVAGAASALGCQWGFLRARRLRLLDREAGSADLLDPPNRLERKLIRRIGTERVRRLLTFLDRRAAATVVSGQFFSVVRTLMPRLAGRAGVSHRRFSFVNVPAAFVWAALLVTLGRIAGAAFDQVSSAVGLAGLPVVLVAAVVGSIVLVVRRRRSRADARPGAETSRAV
ncbi:VTT domain-containing protein [Saccharopolyspora sp. NFXS83]|uniref:DedA family protein n=1 Tax=Saccharopolyspora sp. NFXS83 TaxID=2993560 RepID=UPI00224AFA98|nr:VTT domain-containing protein [Saccharopolyspora sp. NFXS83]MCX2733159.1 VTT domain-containing protein [Saccharopolyspora sp. NFXS83]